MSREYWASSLADKRHNAQETETLDHKHREFCKCLPTLRNEGANWNHKGFFSFPPQEKHLGFLVDPFNKVSRGSLTGLFSNKYTMVPELGLSKNFGTLLLSSEPATHFHEKLVNFWFQSGINLSGSEQVYFWWKYSEWFEIMCLNWNRSGSMLVEKAYQRVLKGYT